MNRPHIEQNDRGITLNKSLAWTMLVGLLGAGVWLGANMTETQEAVSTLADRQSEDRQEIRQNARAINSLRNSNARIDERLINIERSVRNTEDQLGEILRYLRDGAEQ
jgi:septal ring factor EnvC (AmiA/AmiB activator)